MRRLLILAFFISLVVFLMTLSIYLYYLVPISSFSYAATAVVTQDVAGFDVNSTALTFGSIALGGSSSRAINVDNSYSFPIIAKPTVDGSISKIISFEPLKIGPNEKGKLYFSISADSLEMIGNYTGNITISLKRA